MTFQGEFPSVKKTDLGRQGL